MAKAFYSVITGTGSYIPSIVIPNSNFEQSTFYNEGGEKLAKASADIVRKFHEITEIEERTYAEQDHVASDLGFFAARAALQATGCDPESLDYIIVAHNFGDVNPSNLRTDMVPTLAARIKYKLGIANPYCIAYDLPFGCPGWLQAFIQADYYIKSGDAKKVLVIGAETLSRISDPHDIDSMLYSDGAGAAIIESKVSEEPVGVLAHLSRSDTLRHCHLLKMERSYNPDADASGIYLKMNGRKLYEYALNNVPQTVRACLEKAGLDLSDIKMVLMHQANAKINKAIIERIFKLYQQDHVPNDIMPLTIGKLGNNSVATLPILLNMVQQGKMGFKPLQSGDYCLFSSVGAGMNINVVVYRLP